MKLLQIGRCTTVQPGPCLNGCDPGGKGLCQQPMPPLSEGYLRSSGMLPSSFRLYIRGVGRRPHHGANAALRIAAAAAHTLPPPELMRTCSCRLWKAAARRRMRQRTSRGASRCLSSASWACRSRQATQARPRCRWRSFAMQPAALSIPACKAVTLSWADETQNVKLDAESRLAAALGLIRGPVCSHHRTVACQHAETERCI